jgi:heme exporter protein D
MADAPTLGTAVKAIIGNTMESLEKQRRECLKGIEDLKARVAELAAAEAEAERRRLVERVDAPNDGLVANPCDQSIALGQKMQELGEFYRRFPPKTLNVADLLEMVGLKRKAADGDDDPPQKRQKLANDEPDGAIAAREPDHGEDVESERNEADAVAAPDSDDDEDVESEHDEAGAVAALDESEAEPDDAGRLRCWTPMGRHPPDRPHWRCGWNTRNCRAPWFKSGDCLDHYAQRNMKKLPLTPMAALGEAVADRTPTYELRVAAVQWQEEQDRLTKNGAGANAAVPMEAASRQAVVAPRVSRSPNRAKHERTTRRFVCRRRHLRSSSPSPSRRRLAHRLSLRSTTCAASSTASSPRRRSP